jgi:hypothetical protein
LALVDIVELKYQTYREGRERFEAMTQQFDSSKRRGPFRTAKIASMAKRAAAGGLSFAGSGTDYDPEEWDFYDDMRELGYGSRGQYNWRGKVAQDAWANEAAQLERMGDESQRWYDADEEAKKGTTALMRKPCISKCKYLSKSDAAKYGKEEGLYCWGFANHHAEKLGKVSLMSCEPPMEQGGGTRKKRVKRRRKSRKHHRRIRKGRQRRRRKTRQRRRRKKTQRRRK